MGDYIGPEPRKLVIVDQPDVDPDGDSNVHVLG
jgi:hypothetical protein